MSAVLVVCTANVFRSPLVAGLLTARISGSTFTSAGLRARPGEPMAAPARTALGLDGFRSRQLTADLVDAADAVITMTWAELSETARLSPRALPKAVTLGELARAAAARASGGFATLVADAVRDRGLAHVEEVPDPRDANARRLEDTTARITRLVDVVAETVTADAAGAR
ncbi:hypothetical protein [Amycolatopsis solani]|uniref:arsenate reductase/protein-tyrosine-phosphatase family protein n=1 Tax=Amycolatopsis solani TaxID=3028615 RepID=UPI0025B253A5|nr:hypothetical protein [Amycolatopsis sp. MEP2-6]